MTSTSTASTAVGPASTALAITSNTVTASRQQLVATPACPRKVTAKTTIRRTDLSFMRVTANTWSVEGPACDLVPIYHLTPRNVPHMLPPLPPKRHTIMDQPPRNHDGNKYGQYVNNAWSVEGPTCDLVPIYHLTPRNILHMPPPLPPKRHTIMDQPPRNHDGNKYTFESQKGLASAFTVMAS